MQNGTYFSSNVLHHGSFVTIDWLRLGLDVNENECVLKNKQSSWTHSCSVFAKKKTLCQTEEGKENLLLLECYYYDIIDP